jgi:hypothetical protein
MKHASSIAVLHLIGCLAVMTTATPARAQGGTSGAAAAPPLNANQRKAQEHFHRAEDLYHKGSYREAIPELELARKLDPDAPDAKNIVLDLGIVNEKLAKYPEAIGYLNTFLTMPGVTAAERTRVEGMIKRIQGAMAKAPAPEPATEPPPNNPPTPAPPPATERDTEPQHGRVDALTITFGSIAALGLLGGAGVGVYALTQRPTGFVTGKDGSYATLQDQTDTAHTFAVVADIALGVGVVATIATAWLYFGRTKAVGTNTARISAAPVRSGGAVFVGGTF